MRAIGDIAYDLKKAERLTFGREPCSHTEHNPNCPWCCFKQLAAEYIAYHDQPQAQTATGAHDPKTIKRLDAAADDAWQHFQLLTAMPSISALTRIDAKIKYDDARRRLSRAKWHRLMANQKADRRARRTGKFNRREVTDGYIRTGKTMMIDGERVPIVRKVRVPK